ncbi:MAG: preprotein translocase subunit SecA, partial [Planctomycetes bacterium]|nr:preprotein translocase subunit SecA [Planctomycetota bacterium]
NAIRPDDAWVEKAKELQGEDISKWVFKPYGMYTEGGNKVWKMLDRLPYDINDPTFEAPEEVIPLSRGIHVVTTCDYLAARDAEYNRPLFEFLGLTVGAIQSNMDSEERIPQYSCDITYGTNNEFGFDYLRDNLKVRAEAQVQRSRFIALVDEVDSVLIDEARTPLIISGSTDQSTDNYYLADRVARKLEGVDQNTIENKIAENMKQGMQREDARIQAEEHADFVFSERDHSAKLTERGMNKALRILGMKDIYSGENLDMPHYIDNALRAHSLYKLDHHYIVRDGQVYIVDEHTGRVLEGRRWSDGLHQAVEAKEHLKIKSESQTVATITFQNFFKLYERIGGMTGTAMTEAKEFDRIYKLGVVQIPTNRPLRRINYPDLIYGTAKEKYTSLIDHIADVHAMGRPILIGTVSVERSEVVSEMLKQRGIKHSVLNAKHHAREAEIVAEAGQMGNVTVATNMAGRGTDIVLGTFTREQIIEHWQKYGLAPKKGIKPEMSDEELMPLLLPMWVKFYLADLKEDYESKTPDEWMKLLEERWKEYGLTGPKLCTTVAEMGGLHIVGTERHEARRIDNQLRGRSGRQGDPGSSRFFLSLEDDTMRLFAPDKVKSFMQWAGLKDGMPIESRMVSRTVENAQRKVEERNYEIRKNLLEYDQVMNEQRHIIYDRRQAWLEGRETRESMLEYCENVIRNRVAENTMGHVDDWDLPALVRFMADSFFIELTVADLKKLQDKPDPTAAIGDFLYETLEKAYEAKEKALGEDIMRMLEKMLLLETVDRKWMDHLYAMDILKEGIHLWSYAQQDPKIRYKREGYALFEELWGSLEDEVAELIMKIHPARPREETQQEIEEAQLKERVKIEATVHDEFDSFANQANSVGAGAGEASVQTIVREQPKVKPNQPCPCGSGKKFKKCCGHK